MRVGCYIDGFNLYHAVDDLGDDRLKWVDLRSLAESYLTKGDILVRVAFFTALNTWNAEKRARHVNYITALEHTGVHVVLSKFDKVSRYCYQQDRYCDAREEKQTDVAIAVELMSDCYEAGIERVLLVTADSDQIPMVTRVRESFPDLIVYLIAPPKRLAVARDLGKCCSGISELTRGRLFQHLLPAEIRNQKGKLIATRPARVRPI